jgi:hypothetical protein
MVKLLVYVFLICLENLKIFCNKLDKTNNTPITVTKNNININAIDSNDPNIINRDLTRIIIFVSVFSIKKLIGLFQSLLS